MKKRKQISQRELAAAFGVNTRHIRRLKALGMPTSSVQAARAWREANITPDSDDGDLNALRGDVLKARARLLRLEFDVRMHALIETAEAERVMVAAAQASRNRLLGAPQKLRAEFPQVPPEAIDRLREIIEGGLNLISADLRAIGISSEPPA